MAIRPIGGSHLRNWPAAFAQAAQALQRAILLSALWMREVVREALRVCSTPLLTALASATEAAATGALAAVASPAAMAVRAFFTAVRSELRTAWLRSARTRR